MKKIFYLILILCMLCITFTAPPVAAASVNEYKSTQILIDLDIMKPINDNNVMLVDTVKRKDFAVIIAKILMGGAEIKLDNKYTFADVPKKDETASAISIAVSAGIFTGDSNGNFEPDNAITFEQAVKCIVMLLGYDFRAKETGGYPIGYISTATSLGVLKGVNAGLGEFISLQQLSDMLFNTIKVPIYTQTAYGTDSVTYTTDQNTTLLKKYFNVVSDSGIVTANFETALEGISGLHENEVKISEKNFNVGKTNAADFLGKYVTYYYKIEKDEGIDTLVSVELTEDKNDILTIDANEINSVKVTDGTRQIIVEYTLENENKNKSATISPNVDVIYNGKANTGFKADDFKPEMGSITLADNNGDNIYEVVFVDAYESILANQVSVNFGWVSDMYRKNDDNTAYVYNLHAFDSDYILHITRDGTTINMADIKVWDVLTIYKSKSNGKQLISVTVTRNSLSGIIEEYDEENITINGDKYKLNFEFQKAIKNGEVSVLIGKTKTFYLNHKGEIVGFDMSKQEGKYAFVRKVAPTNDISNLMELRIFDVEKNKWITLKSAKKLYIDDVLANNVDIKGLERKLIRYEMNAEGDLSRAYMPKSEFDQPRMMTYNGYTNSLAITNEGSEKLQFFINQDTITITVPANETDYDDENLYRLGSSFDDTHKYTMNFFDSKSYIIGALVNEIQDAATKVDDGVGFIITNVIQSVDADGNNVIKLKGYSGANQSEYILSTDLINSDTFKTFKLCRGDVVRFALNAKGVAIAIAVDFCMEKNFNNGFKATGNAFAPDYAWFYGKIHFVDVTKNIIAVDVSNNPQTPDLFTSYIPVVIINENNGERFYKGDARDLRAGQQVFFKLGVRNAAYVQVFAMSEGLEED